MLSPGRILVVEDDPALIEAVEATLDPPHRVCSVQKGIQALDLLKQHRPDLVLLDYVLPDGSGLEILRVIRRAAPTLPIILMTGFGSEDVAVESFRNGVRDYLKKPFTALDLLARVQQALGAEQGPESNALISGEPTEPRYVEETYRVSQKSVQRAMFFVEEHLNSSVPLDDVAREAGMSKFHFCRVFKTVTGLTFRKFLARRRIARAAELLRDNDRSLMDVCLEVGFKDVSHFSRVFRRVTGELPSHFRRGVAKPDGSVTIRSDLASQRIASEEPNTQEQAIL